LIIVTLTTSFYHLKLLDILELFVIKVFDTRNQELEFEDVREKHRSQLFVTPKLNKGLMEFGALFQQATFILLLVKLL